MGDISSEAPSGGSFFKSAAAWAAKSWRAVVLAAAGFAAASALNFLNVATSQSVAARDVSEFEVGQIADRSIFSDKEIPGDSLNPKIESGERIIRKGFPITPEEYSKLTRLSESPVYFDARSFANSELYLALLLCVWILLFAFVPLGRKAGMREMVMQVAFFVIVYGAAAFGVKLQPFASPFMVIVIIPSALFVLLDAMLYGPLSAALFSVVAALGVLDAARMEIVPFLFTLLSGVAAANIARRVEKRMDMAVVAAAMAALQSAAAVMLAVMFNEDLGGMARPLFAVAANGFLSGIFALGLVTPLELALNTASIFRLMDLGDLNNPMMRRLMLTASGTYAHSVMVAQLSESACREIGANAMLARIGAYYHDIGKMDQSEYFVENQSGENKHDDMNPLLSVAVIKSHVKKGVEKARQMHLPSEAVDIIAEHHGSSLISYFYNEAKKSDPGANPDDFSYPGPVPSTKESAVVMLADTVEAACRTLDNPTAPRIEKFIQTLFQAKIDQRQLDGCSLTFSDLSKIRSAFASLLAAYYHNRVKYPNQKDPDSSDGEKNGGKGEKSAEKAEGKGGARKNG